MRRLRARWLGVTATLAALASAGLLLWLAMYLRGRGLDWDARLSEIVSAAMVVGAAVVSAAGRVVRWLPAPRLKDEQVQSDLADLAAALRAQGRPEGAPSGLYVYDRLPMPVRWRPATGLRLRSADPAPDDETEAPAGTFDEVLEYFRALPEPRLLVLGDAGAGKTVLVTELARRLLATRAPGDPVPVVIPATAWNPTTTSLFDWVSQQLVRINADLARMVSDGRRSITRAQALVDRMKVLPILDGLDEIAEADRPKSTIAINQYGWAQPLVVTCRTGEYLQAIATERGTPVARVAAVTLQPLEVADIKEYLGLGAGGRWRAVYDRLDAEPDGPIAQALANPLMLWLAWAVYSGGRQAAELTDGRRFGSAGAIDDHLLAEFAPAVYPDSEERPSGSGLRQVLSLQRRPQRWLGFLAADAAEYYRRTRRKKRTAARRPIDLFEARDDQNVAWWRFTGAAGPLRIAGVLIRGGMLWAVAWKLIYFELGRNGYLRHGSFAGHIHFRQLLLSGPVGRAAWPAVERVINVAPAHTRRHAFSDINTFVQLIFQHHSSAAIFWVLVGAILVAAIRARSEPARPRHLHISLRTLSQFARDVLWAVMGLAFAVWAVLSYWHRTNLASSIFTARSTWYAVVAVGLALSLPGFPLRLVAPTDVVGAVGPLESLRMDRWADIVVTTTRRVIFAGVIVLISGAQLAFTYLIFAAVTIFVALVLGGRGAAASRSYTDACIWLAMTGRLPWRPMRFLDDAQRRGVFQEIGAIFRFRHARVQRQLRAWHEHHRLDLTKWPAAAFHRLADEMATDRAATLAGARERVASYRKLAERDLGEFGPDLARALRVEVDLLQAQGYQDEELDALARLVDTRRKLADADPASRPALARSLLRFAQRLEAAGRYEQTFGLMTEAAQTLCMLTAAERDAYLPELESSLSWLARVEGPSDRHVPAARAVNAVLSTYSAHVRGEVHDDPDAHAASLVGLGHLLRRHSGTRWLRHDARAAEVLNEAAQIYAENALAEPAAAWAGRAKALSDLAAELAGLEPTQDAAAALASSVAIYRELTRLDPATYRPLLIGAACRLATMKTGSAREQELAAIREAVGEYRALAGVPGAPGTGGTARDRAGPGGADVAAGAPLLAGLSSLALRLWRLGMQDEAVEAAVIGRELSAAGPAEDQQGMVWDEPAEPAINSRVRALRLLSTAPSSLTEPVERHDTEAFRLMLAGRTDESRVQATTAAVYCRQLVAVYRRLAETGPAHNLPYLAESLELLATQLRKTGSAYADADAAAAEALHIRRRLGLGTPEPTPPEHVAQHLDQHAAQADREHRAPTASPAAAKTAAMLAERTADLQRLQAEYSNYRKRVDRDRLAVREQALANVLSALLPVLDDIGRAREHRELAGGFKSVAESLEAITVKLGLTAYGEPGDPFDPVLHDALMHEYSAEVTEPTCVRILQPGYRVGDRTIRPARVAVVESAEHAPAPAKPAPEGPPDAEQAEADEAPDKGD